MGKEFRKQDGFSLIEMLFAIVIFMVVMVAIFGVFRIGLITRNSINNRSETVASARTAINAVGREAINAGLGFSRTGSVVPDNMGYELFGIPKDPGNQRDLFTGVMAGDEVSDSDLSLPGEKNDIVAFIYRDLNWNDGDPYIIKDYDEFSNIPILDAGSGGCSICKKFDLYQIEDASGKQAMAMVTDIGFGRWIAFNDNDPLNLNRETDDPGSERSVLRPCSGASDSNCFNYDPQVTFKRIFLTSYSVDANGTLVRKTYGNNTGQPANEQIQTQELAHNVQRFQVKYLLRDGRKVDDPAEGNVNHQVMNDVVQIEIRITIQAEGNDQGVTRVDTIDLKSTFSTRNLRYDVE